MRTCKNCCECLFIYSAHLEKIHGVLYTLKGAATASAQSLTSMDARLKSLEDAFQRHYGTDARGSSDPDGHSSLDSSHSDLVSPLSFPIPADCEIELDTLEAQLRNADKRELLVSCGTLLHDFVSVITAVLRNYVFMSSIILFHVIFCR